MQMNSHELEGLAHANAVLISSNTEVMAQLAKIIMTINAMQAQLKTIVAAPTNKKMSKR